MVEPLVIGLGINFVQLVLLFVAGIFAAITAVFVAIVFLIGYLIFVAYLYEAYSKAGAFYGGIQLIIMSTLVFIIVGLLGGFSAVMTFGLLFVLPALFVYLITLAPFKNPLETL
ncbi:MAG: hypothetical protein WC157_00950 [Candidatus Paceibacterota bacterium]